MRRIALCAGLLCLVLDLSGCYRTAYGYCAFRIKTGDCRADPSAKPRADVDLIAADYAATDQLLRGAIPAMSPRSRLVVATIADINALEDSTPLGRLITEHVSARLVQQGFTVLDPKLQNNLLMIPDVGEFALSRELREYGQSQAVDRLVAGTYTVGKDTVYVSLKLLNFATGQVTAAHNYSLPMGGNVENLVAKTSWW
ncbi:MAG: FlgO family outer membrane protein [Thiotrichaceae bacterium]|nr:FlgO family outer membrane protein [Thiotrichaceae bacterium]